MGELWASGMKTVWAFLMAVAALLASGLAKASAQSSPAPPWPPRVASDGYLPGIPGDRSRFLNTSFVNARVETTVSGCQPYGGMTAIQVPIGLGPVDAEGWVSYIDLMSCSTGRRLLRIDAPRVKLEPWTDAASMRRSMIQALDEGIDDVLRGNVFHLRKGGFILLDRNLKRTALDPERVLLTQGRSGLMLVMLAAEPGLYLPVMPGLKPYPPPPGMIGFMGLVPKEDKLRWQEEPFPASNYRAHVAVWQTPAGRRFGLCGRSLDSIEEWDPNVPPPPCEPRYVSVDTHAMQWATSLTSSGSYAYLGEREDGLWEVGHMSNDPVINPTNVNIRFSKIPLSGNGPNPIIASWATPEELAQIRPQPKDALIAALDRLFLARVTAKEEAIRQARLRIAAQDATKRAEDQARAQEAERQRLAGLAQEAERRRLAAEQQRARVAAAIASGDPACWRTTACGLGPRQRYNMALRANDREGARNIALASLSQDRTLVIDDILADRATVQPGRGPAYWTEEKMHAVAANDPVIRQGISDQWRHAERWAAARQAFELERNRQTFWSGLGSLRPVATPPAPGAPALSTLEQEYYIARGYVTVRPNRP